MTILVFWWYFPCHLKPAKGEKLQTVKPSNTDSSPSPSTKYPEIEMHIVMFERKILGREILLFMV